MCFSFGVSYDKFCPFYKSVWMMRNIVHFNTLANQVCFSTISYVVSDPQNSRLSHVSFYHSILFYDVFLWPQTFDSSQISILGCKPPKAAH